MRSPILALTGGTVYIDPMQPPIEGGTVVIEGGAIASAGRIPAPAGAGVLDCRGCTVLAGFWNSHVHFFERKWADAATLPAPELGAQLESTFTRYGFTSVFDLSSPHGNTRALRARIDSGEIEGPGIRTTGAGLLPQGALPADVVLQMMGLMRFASPEIASPEDAAAAARKLIEDGADGVKLFASGARGSALPRGAIAAAAEVAHRAGKPVFVHPNTGADVLAALEEGADVIAHTTPHSGPWDDGTLAHVARRSVALTPTLTLWTWFLRHDRRSAREKAAAASAAQLRAFIERGGTALFGTDLGAVEPDPGPEHAAMAAAGMRFRDILASLTTAPAKAFGASDRVGRIAPGMQADLVVVRGDPGSDLRALTDVRWTVRSGRIVYRAA
jgi:imidazolonepropionase-like amidohydrolase